MFEILEKQELILRMRSSVDSVAAQLSIFLNLSSRLIIYLNHIY